MDEIVAMCIEPEDVTALRVIATRLNSGHALDFDGRRYLAEQISKVTGYAYPLLLSQLRSEEDLT